MWKSKIIQINVKLWNNYDEIFAKFYNTHMHAFYVNIIKKTNSRIIKNLTQTNNCWGGVGLESPALVLHACLYMGDVVEECIAALWNVFDKLMHRAGLSTQISNMDRGAGFVGRNLTADVKAITHMPFLRQRHRDTPVPADFGHDTFPVTPEVPTQGNAFDLNKLSLIWHSLDADRRCGRAG